MCRYFYGPGPWDDLAIHWNAVYAPALLSTSGAAAESRALIRESLPVLRRVVELTIDTQTRAFNGRSLRAMVQPERVSPKALDELERRIGPALFTSAHWLWTEPVRIMALTGLAVARRPRELKAILRVQEQSMLRLGGALQAA
jgi:hypothetical protein